MSLTHQQEISQCKTLLCHVGKVVAVLSVVRHREVRVWHHRPRLSCRASESQRSERIGSAQHKYRSYWRSGFFGWDVEGGKRMR